MSNKNHDFDGFTVNLFLDEEGDWIAHFVEMPSISAFSNEPKAALDELKVAWELVKEDYRAHNEEIPVAPANTNYNGQFSVQIDKRVHRELAAEATQIGLSLNALVAEKLARDYEGRL